VPVLVTGEGVLSDSTDILKWADRKAAPGRGLYGDTDAERREIEALEDLFDEDLGPHTRRWVYFYVLPRRDLLLGMVTGVPDWERRALGLIFPAARALMRKAMRITPEGAARSRAKIDEVFAKVGGIIADGRPFLSGSRLSAADLTFASLAAPVLLPPTYGAPLPRPQDLPAEAATLIEAWQAHPAGQFALRLYREHRQ
jgi:glutathione S-transferase